MLPVNFEEPASFQWGSFTDAGGAKIRYGSLQPAGAPKGTIVLAPGFREPIEKYFEVIRDMTDKGFAVWMLDWHGQGGSDRFFKDDPQKMYSNDFSEHIATLHQFTNEVIQKSSGPLILAAHSMGAHIGLRYLKEHDGVFNSAIFTSPMCEMKTRGYPRPVAVMLAKVAQAGHFLGKYVPKGHDWDEKRDAVFATTPLTSDPVRFGVIPELYRQKPALRMGEPTYGWVLRSFQSIAVLRDEAYLRAIKTPMLIGVAGSDEVVEAAATVRACGLLQNCKRVDIPASKHEIWMERDELRTPWVAKVGVFLEERLGQQQPAPKKANKNNVKRPPRLG